MSGSWLDIRLIALDRLAQTLEEIDRRTGLLSPEERGWESTADPQQARRRRVARIALRLLLLHAGAAGARGQAISTDVHGKPSLVGAALSFNVSHSGGLAALAVASSGPIGIDLEQPRSVSLSPQRQALIISAAAAFASEPVGQGGFLVAWTSLEAFAKARGTGIGALLTDLGITAQGSRTLSPLDVAERAAGLLRASGLAVLALDLPHDLAGSICAPTRIMATRPDWSWLTEQQALDICGAA